MSEESIIEIGIPCKYSEVVIIPKHIWDYVEDDIVCICRGGEKVKLELEKVYKETTDISQDCMELYKTNFHTIQEIWKKRCQRKKFDEGWVKVKMNLIKGND